jgi:hypothetical protein
MRPRDPGDLDQSAVLPDSGVRTAGVSAASERGINERTAGVSAASERGINERTAVMRALARHVPDPGTAVPGQRGTQAADQALSALRRVPVHGRRQ